MYCIVLHDFYGHRGISLIDFHKVESIYMYIITYIFLCHDHIYVVREVVWA